MSDSSLVRRVVMSKSVSRTWLQKQAHPEYRFRVFNPQAKDYPSVLRSFRDGKLKLKLGSETIPPVSDLGVKEEFGGFYVWSSDLESLKNLQQWFEGRGLETSWIW